MIEQGRPLMWGISHSPTASKYRARSSFVTGLPSPPSGHSSLSGFEMTTPMTSVDVRSARAGCTPVGCRDVAVARATGLTTLVVTGSSALTSLAGLFCRDCLRRPMFAMAPGFQNFGKNFRIRPSADVFSMHLSLKCID